MKLKNSASNLQLQSPIKALLRSSSSAFENLVHFMLTEPHQSGLELQQSYLWFPGADTCPEHRSPM